MASIQTVVLLGKVGHGKTSMMNKLCGSRHPVGMGAKSLTDHVQHGMMTSNVAVIDSPGFYSSTDVAGHVGATKAALEEIPLSGIYLVVKYGRADDIAEVANTIMDVLECDDLRIAITHEDIAASQAGVGFDPTDLRRTLSARLGIEETKICSFGSTTPALTVKAFIQATLHEPRQFKLSSAQLGKLAGLGSVTRAVMKPINAVFAKIVAAEEACRQATRQGRGYESDYLIVSTQKATSDVVEAAKGDIFKSVEDNTEAEQHIVYGKAGVTLCLRLQDFITTTNSLLSYDVTDTSSAQNLAKKCNYCGAVFVKTEGCDGETTCGNVPSAFRISMPVALQPQFEEKEGRWTLMFRHHGDTIWRSAFDTWSWIRQTTPFQTSRTVNKGDGTCHRKRPEALIESGCGNSISWTNMVPLSDEEYARLGDMKKAELMIEPASAETAKAQFEEQVQIKERENKMLLANIK